ncbi:MAG: TRAP transporter small permease [Gammaproteobacteria bacterium]
MLSYLITFRNGLISIENLLAAASLLLILLLVALQIFSRNLFDIGLPNIDTLSRQLVLFIIFFGSMLAIERRQHITIDIICSLCPASRRPLFRFLNLVAVGICTIFTFSAMRFWKDAWQYASPSEHWQVLIGLIIPAGFMLLSLHFFLSVILGPDRITYKMTAP